MSNKLTPEEAFDRWHTTVLGDLSLPATVSLQDAFIGGWKAARGTVDFEEALEVVGKKLPDKVGGLRNAAWEKDHQPTIADIRQRFNVPSGYWLIWRNPPTFQLSKTFDNREALLAWVNEQGLALPEKMNKSGFIRDDKAMTRCTYTIPPKYEEFDGELEIYYDRDGLPTTKCKVVTTVSQSVVCPLDEE